MKKIILTILGLIFFTTGANCETITGGVNYTVDSARIIAFDNSPLKISKDEFKDYFKDPDFKQNMAFLKGKEQKPKGRIVTPFYMGKTLILYCVEYDNVPEKRFYYGIGGSLVKIDVCDNLDEYPAKLISYNRRGNLISVHLIVSEKESFAFDKDKNLQGHWIDDVLYNKKGKKSKFSRGQ